MTISGNATYLPTGELFVTRLRAGPVAARADVEIRTGALLQRMQQLMDAVRAFWSTTAYPGTLPPNPSATADGQNIEA